MHTQVIQERLGHASSRTTTDIYGFVPDETDRAAAASLGKPFEHDRGLPVACGGAADRSA